MSLDELRAPIFELYRLLSEELSRNWKSYTVTINDETYELHPECHPSVRSTVIKQLLKDALNAQVDSIDNPDYEGVPFAVIVRIFAGECKEDHQFERVKSEVVSNLDENGNPITAKPLNEENVLVQWQDQNKFKFETSEESHEEFVQLLREKRPDCEYLKKFDEYARTRLTDQEMVQIEKEAQTEVLELKEKV